MRKQAGRIVVLAVATLAFAPSAVAQDEGGGQSGADFLLDPPAARSDAMGGVVDGQGNPLEGMLFNPSVLMLDPAIRLNVGITPLPNGVTNTALTFGAPLGPGMLGVSGQLLSLGEFTYINPAGQPQGSVTLFDAAASAGYSMYVWDQLAVGAAAKAVYRSLGESTAFGLGADLGATWWFETPHIGQRPKAPTMDELRTRLDRDLASLEREKEKRTRAAAGDVADLRRQAERLQTNLERIETDLADAEEDADTSRLEENRAATEADLVSTTTALRNAEAEAADDLAAIEQWHREEVALARAAHEARVADLREIQAERSRLFEVVDDPDTMLEAEEIDRNIDDAIDRTQEFLVDRLRSLRSTSASFQATRSARIAELQAQIASYQEQIDEIVGPDGTRLRREIERIDAQISELETARARAQEAAAAAEEAGEDPPPVPDIREQVRALRSQRSATQDDLDDLQSDRWVRRLQRRIEDKESDISGTQRAIETFEADTQRSIERVRAQTEREVDRFEALRENLKRDLRRAQLRRELDLIDARSDRARERALASYEASEQRIYQTLLGAMYTNEENIFRARRALAEQDSRDRRFEFETRISDEREEAEDDFGFQERLYRRQIADLRREDPVDENRVTELEAQLEQLRFDYDERIAGISERETSFRETESARLASELAAIRDERRKVRLIFLQTDDPYRNTAVTLAIRNLGTNITFEETGYPMPRTAALGLSYALVNTDMHTVRISSEAEMPLYGSPTLADLQVGVGMEYGFAGIVDVRAGYGFGSPERSFSVGFGVDFALGFTNYAVDYVFRPLPDYGLQHSVGVAIGF